MQPSWSTTSSSSTGPSETPLVTRSPRGRFVVRQLLVYLVLRRFLRVLPGDSGSSTVSPSPHGGRPGFSTDVLRNVRDVRSTTPLILGFSFLVEVGVNLTNPVDSVSLSLWTGRAVIQAYGCGHPGSWKNIVCRRTCWYGLRRYRRIWYSGFWNGWPRWYSWWYGYCFCICWSFLQSFPRQHGSARPSARGIVSFPSSLGPHSCIPGNGKANDEGRHIHRKRM